MFFLKVKEHRDSLKRKATISPPLSLLFFFFFLYSQQQVCPHFPQGGVVQPITGAEATARAGFSKQMSQSLFRKNKQL